MKVDYDIEVLDYLIEYEQPDEIDHNSSLHPFLNWFIDLDQSCLIELVKSCRYLDLQHMLKVLNRKLVEPLMIRSNE